MVRLWAPLLEHERKEVETVKTDVLIIGAGPYGISLAYDLYKRNIHFQIIGKPFSLWFDHLVPGIQLRSDWRASQLYSRDGHLDIDRYLRMHYSPQKVYSVKQGRVPSTLFQDYLRWVLKELPFQVIDEKILELHQDGSEFVAQTSSGGELRARRVVCATGIESHRYLPRELASLPAVVHGWNTREYGFLKNSRLLVVGGGQSAAEAIACLSDCNQITWVYRSPLVFFSEPINLPKPLFDLALRLSACFYRLPRGASWLLGRRFLESTITPDLKSTVMRESILRLQIDVADLGLIPGGPERVYSQRLNEAFDKVIACTGYHYALSTIRFLSPDLLRRIASRNQVPALNRHYETSLKNLYMVGGIAEPTHGPAQRFMFGCRDATRTVGAALAGS